MTARIFDRPDLGQQLGQKALYVAGLFPSGDDQRGRQRHP